MQAAVPAQTQQQEQEQEQEICPLQPDLGCNAWTSVHATKLCDTAGCAPDCAYELLWQLVRKLRLQQVGVVNDHAARGSLHHLHNVSHCLRAGHIHVHLNVPAAAPQQ
jgi:hypothetical protein